MIETSSACVHVDIIRWTNLICLGLGHLQTFRRSRVKMIILLSILHCGVEDSALGGSSHNFFKLHVAFKMTVHKCRGSSRHKKSKHHPQISHRTQRGGTSWISCRFSWKPGSVAYADVMRNYHALMSLWVVAGPWMRSLHTGLWTQVGLHAYHSFALLHGLPEWLVLSTSLPSVLGIPPIPIRLYDCDCLSVAFVSPA